MNMNAMNRSRSWDAHLIISIKWIWGIWAVLAECACGRRKWGLKMMASGYGMRIRYGNYGPNPESFAKQPGISPMVCFLDGHSAKYYLSGGKQFKTRLYSFKHCRTVSNYIFSEWFFCLVSTGLWGIVASTATISFRVGDRTSPPSINLRIIWLPTD